MIKSVELIEFPIFEEDNGELSVFEQNFDAIPFLIKRIFNKVGKKQYKRKACSSTLFSITYLF